MKKTALFICFVLISVLTANAQTKTTASGKTYDIILPRGNSILEFLPLSDLDLVDSLRVSGIMYKADWEIIKKCKNVKYLDLFFAIPNGQYLKDKEKEYVFGGLNQMVEERGGGYVLSYLDYQGAREIFNQYFDWVNNVKSNEYFRMEEGFSDKGPDFNEFPKLEMVILPQILNVLNSNSFCNLPKLKYVYLPQRLTFIPSGSFNNCPLLNEVVFSKQLGSIHDNCFRGCPNLVRIVFPKSLSVIGRGSFDDSPLKNIDFSGHKWEDYGTFRAHWPGMIFIFSKPDNSKIKRTFRFPEGIRTICITAPGDELFLPQSFETNIAYLADGSSYVCNWRGCTIHLSSQTPPELYPNSIENATLYVPKGSLTAYYVAFGDKVKLIEE